MPTRVRRVIGTFTIRMLRRYRLNVPYSKVRYANTPLLLAKE